MHFGNGSKNLTSFPHSAKSRLQVQVSGVLALQEVIVTPGFHKTSGHEMSQHPAILHLAARNASSAMREIGKCFGILITRLLLLHYTMCPA